jgi:hypothetical protein
MPFIKILFSILIKIYMNATYELLKMGHELDEFSQRDVLFFVKIRTIRVQLLGK